MVTVELTNEDYIALLSVLEETVVLLQNDHEAQQEAMHLWSAVAGERDWSGTPVKVAELEGDCYQDGHSFNFREDAICKRCGFDLDSIPEEVGA